MADEAKDTQGEETKTPTEGTVEAELSKETKETKDTVEKNPDTVPLSVFLDLKQDVKELRKALKEANDSKKDSIQVEGLEDLETKYPDVDKNFLRDILGLSTKQVEAKFEEKFTPIIKEADAKRQQEAFDKAFDRVFDKALKDNPDLPETVDKEAIKALALTPAYKNTPVADILTKIYGNSKGTSSSENDMRTAGDKTDDIVSFENLSEAQRQAVMADDKSRAKYFAWLDANGK